MNVRNLLYVFLGLAVIGGGGGALYMKARGLRNNNAGNIRHGDKWQGMSDTQTDKSFIQFTDPIYGIRAINRILRTYQRRGINTVSGVISRWAPPNENDTGAYISAVASKLNVEPNEVIDLEIFAPELTEAIIKHENGLQPYDVATINQGVTMGWA